MSPSDALEKARFWMGRLAQLKKLLSEGGTAETAALAELSAMMSLISDYNALHREDRVFEAVMNGIMGLLE